MPNNPNARDNLIPAKKGEVRNPRGNHKGTKHLSTWIQDILNDEDFTLDNFLANGKQFKGAPIKAIIMVGISNALQGDDKWANWLSKNGYGTKIDVTSDGEKIQTYDPATAAAFSEYLKEKTKE